MREWPHLSGCRGLENGTSPPSLQWPDKKVITAFRLTLKLEGFKTSELKVSENDVKIRSDKV